MSHFQVFVITNEEPDDDIIEKALLPYHKFASTGLDVYIVEEDISQETLADYQTKNTHRIFSPDGQSFNAYDDLFYRDATVEELEKDRFTLRVRDIPDGWEEREVPINSVMTFIEFIKYWHGWTPVPFDAEPDLDGDDKFGYCKLKEDGYIEKIVRRHNPNSKWDWYVIGGRFGGYLIAKSNSAQTASGVPGAFGPNSRQKESSGCDIIRRGDMDFEAMRNRNIEDRRGYWTEVLSKCLEETDCETEADVFAHWANFANNVDAATQRWEAEGPDVRRWEWWKIAEGLPEEFVSSLNSGIPQIISDPFFGLGIDESNPDIQDWINSALPFTTYAVLHCDRGWIARGEMGWFGMSSDKVSQKDWQEQVVKMIEELPEDYWITAVDCHI